MRTVVLASQIVAALGIFNVWFVRFGKATSYRGGSARSLKEEFQVYGLPGWSVGVIGFLKVLCGPTWKASLPAPTNKAPAAMTSSSSWPSIRVTVTCSKSGSLKSGQCNSSPCARRRSAKNAALVAVGDDAKPCR